MDQASLSRRTLLKGGGAALAELTMLQVTAPVHAFGQPDEEVLPWLDQPPPPLPSDATDNLQPWERLDISGLVAQPRSLSIDDLKSRERQHVDFTLECSGNNGFDWFSSAVGNARWAGTPLEPLLEQAGIPPQASEVVFYGIDHGTVTIRDSIGILSGGHTGVVESGPDGNLVLTITEQFARSMSVAEALHRKNLLCYEMNGAPLPPEHGFPVRLIAPKRPET